MLKTGSAGWLVFGCVLVVLSWSLSASPRYTIDSVSYRECADNICQGRGFLVRPLGGLRSDLREPIALWPPGYPILIAVVMAVGVSALNAGLVVAFGSGLIALVLLIGLAERQRPHAIPPVAVLVIGLSPGFQRTSTMYWSDMPLLAVTLAVFRLMVSWDEHRTGWWRLSLSGILSGIGLWLRNPALALVLAVSVFLVLGRVGRRWSLRALMHYWLFVAVVFAPLLARNLAVFGRLLPYDRPLANMDMKGVLLTMMKALATDFTGSNAVGAPIGRYAAVAGVAVIIVVTVGVVRLWTRRSAVRGDLRVLVARHRALFQLGSLYVVAYLALLVATWSRFTLGESINWRYLMQVEWLVWLAVFALLSVVWPHLIRLARFRSAAWIAVAGVLVGMQALGLAHTRVRRDWAPITAAVAGFAGIIPDRSVVLTDLPVEMRMFAGVNARLLTAALTPDDVKAACANGFLWGAVIGHAENLPLARTIMPAMGLANSTEGGERDSRDGPRLWIMRCDPRQP